jgi:Family of unknown function (DUF5317)
MFILYAIPIGIIAGYLAGGRLERLGSLRLRWVPLALIGLAIQVVLFSEPFGPWPAGFVPAVYQASTAMVLIAVLRNLAVPGVTIIAVGAACNLAAIVANGGWMPADPAALDSVGGLPPGASNSIVVSQPALLPLTDLFALPSWLPLANVFSVGDVLIGVGVATTIALAMRTVARPSPVEEELPSAAPEPLP